MVWFAIINTVDYRINVDLFELRYMGIGLSAQGVNMNRLPGMYS